MTATKVRLRVFFFGVFFAALPSSVLADDESVAPPAADETLIYVMREGRFTGGGTKVWIAVNDQTVARVKNKGHAIIRAKAGRITLNLASTGLVYSQIALDDRPGETVYLTWRLGDFEFTEVGEVEAAKFLRKSKRTDPIEKVLPNNEEVDTLINLSRLGLDLMQPASDERVPDETNATVTFLRRGDAKKLEFGIWGQRGFVGSLAAFEATTISVPAGEHFFIAGNVGKSLLKLEADAGKRYYAWLDFGSWIGRVRLTPITLAEASDLTKWLDDAKSVELNPDAMSARIREREGLVTEFIERVVKKTGTDAADFHLLGSEHAFE